MAVTLYHIDHYGHVVAGTDTEAVKKIKESDYQFSGYERHCPVTGNRCVLFTNTELYNWAITRHQQSPMFTTWGYGLMFKETEHNVTFEQFQNTSMNPGLLVL